MRRKGYLFLIVGWAFVCGGMFVVIARAIEKGTIEKFDVPIIQFVQGLEMESLTFMFKMFTWIGSGYGVTPITVIICCLLFFKFKRQIDACFVAFTMISTILLNEGLKRVFTRERPEIYRLMDAGGYSFPSGHTMMAVSLYTMVVYAFWRHMKSSIGRTLLLIGSLLTAFLIAMSRIYVGVHFPSDIAGGFFMSALWLTILFAGYDQIRRRIT